MISSCSCKLPLKGPHCLECFGLAIVSQHLVKLVLNASKTPEKVYRVKLVRLLARRLQDHPNSSLEDNKFCLSVHYRKMDPQHHQSLINAVKTLVQRDHPELETKDGRKVVEVRPKV